MKRGYMDWNKELLPQSALESRRQALLEAAQKEDIQAVVVYGDVYSADELSFYVNYAPYWCNCVAVLTQDDLYMVTGHNNRVNPWIHTLTGIEQEKLLASGFKVPERTAQSLKEHFPDGARIGIVGKYTMDTVANALKQQGFELVEMDAAITDNIRMKDASYKNTVLKATEILKNAFEIGHEDYAKGGTSRTVTAEIEYGARKNGAMDIVMYVAYDSRAFGLPEVRDDAKGTWTVCALMQYLGVWVSMTETFGADLKNVKEMLEEAGKGLVPGELKLPDRVKVSQVLSDSISDLNEKMHQATEGQILFMEAQDADTGVSLGGMYQVTEEGAVAL